MRPRSPHVANVHAALAVPLLALAVLAAPGRAQGTAPEPSHAPPEGSSSAPPSPSSAEASGAPGARDGASKGAKREADGDALLSAVPEDAFFVLSVEDVAGLRATAVENAWYRFATDPRVVHLAERLSGESLELPPEARVALGVAGAVQGSLALFGAPGGEPGTYVAGLFVDPAAGAPRLAPSFDLLLAGLDAELPVDSVAHAGVELILFDLAGIEDGPEFLRGAEHPTLVAFQLDGLTGLVAGAPRERVLEVARGAVDRRRSADAPRGYARNEDLLDARQSIGRAGEIELVVSTGALLAALEHDASMHLDPRVMDALSFSGLRDVRWLYATAGLGAGEALDLRLGAQVPEGTPLARAADLFRPVSTELLALMPESSASVFALGFDVRAAVELGLDLAEDLAPHGEPLHDEAAPGPAGAEPSGSRPDVRRRYADGLAAATAMTGVDFQEELLDQLDGSFGHFMTFDAAGAGDGPLTARTTMLVGLKDGETVELAVETLLESPVVAMLGSRFEVETVGDVDVWTLPGPFGQLGLGWAFLDTALVVSDGRSGLEAVLHVAATDGSRSVLDHPKLGPAIRAADGASMLAMADTPVLLKQALRMLGATARLLDHVRGEGAAAGGAARASRSQGIGGIVDDYFHGVLVQTLERGPRSLRLRFEGR